MTHAGMKPLPSVEEILGRYTYCSDTGEFRYRIRVSNVHPGTIAGKIDRKGYRHLLLNGQQYAAHRLAWKVVHGTDPVGILDHKNGRKDDNRISNLRPATKSQNGMNRYDATKCASGFRGAYKMGNKYGSYIRYNGKQNWLGLYDTPEEANRAYQRRRAELCGEFAPA